MADCTFESYSTFHCDQIRSTILEGGVQMTIQRPGTISNIGLDEFDFPIGIVVE